jgi:hypothetical protein
MFYISLLAGILILGQALYSVLYNKSAESSFSITWNLLAGGYLLFAAYRNYKLMKPGEDVNE